MICPNCNNDNPNDAVFCQTCGASLEDTQQPNPAQPMQSNPTPLTSNSKGSAIAAMVLGIIACVFCWIPYVSIAALICSIIGLVLAVKARNSIGQDGRGIATAGLVLCIIGLILSAIGFVLCTLPVMAAFTLLPYLN